MNFGKFEGDSHILHCYLKAKYLCFTNFFSALTVRYLTRRFIGDYETEHGMYIDQFPSFAYEKYFQSLSMSKLKKKNSILIKHKIQQLIISIFF